MMRGPMRGGGRGRGRGGPGFRGGRSPNRDNGRPPMKFHDDDMPPRRDRDGGRGRGFSRGSGGGGGDRRRGGGGPGRDRSFNTGGDFDRLDRSPDKAYDRVPYGDRMDRGERFPPGRDRPPPSRGGYRERRAASPPDSYSPRHAGPSPHRQQMDYHGPAGRDARDRQYGSPPDERGGGRGPMRAPTSRNSYPGDSPVGRPPRDGAYPPRGYAPRGEYPPNDGDYPPPREYQSRGQQPDRDGMRGGGYGGGAMNRDMVDIRDMRAPPSREYGRPPPRDMDGPPRAVQRYPGGSSRGSAPMRRDSARNGDHRGHPAPRPGDRRPMRERGPSPPRDLSPPPYKRSRSDGPPRNHHDPRGEDRRMPTGGVDMRDMRDRPPSARDGRRGGYGDRGDRRGGAPRGRGPPRR